MDKRKRFAPPVPRVLHRGRNWQCVCLPRVSKICKRGHSRLLEMCLPCCQQQRVRKPPSTPARPSAPLRLHLRHVGIRAYLIQQIPSSKRINNTKFLQIGFSLVQLQRVYISYFLLSHCYTFTYDNDTLTQYLPILISGYFRLHIL